VTTFAASDGTDDTLFRHRDAPKRFTVIHLTWLGRTEINAEHPTVEFDSTYAEFLDNQERRYGLIRISVNHLPPEDVPHM
jgi:hypothetical protein